MAVIKWQLSNGKKSEFFLSCQHTEFDLPHGKIFGVLHTQELQQFCAKNEHNTLVGRCKT